MKQYDVLVTPRAEVVFEPENEVVEIIQNVRTIITTPKYSVPLFRDFGLDGAVADSPINEAGAKLKSDIIMAVREYEPRAQVSYIELVPEDDGTLAVRLRITI